MITVYLNNQTITINKCDSLATILNHHGYIGDYFAITVNRQFVSRGKYADTRLENNDNVEIIFPMQGG